jgi:hypothetical protein
LAEIFKLTKVVLKAFAADQLCGKAGLQAVKFPAFLNFSFLKPQVRIFVIFVDITVNEFSKRCNNPHN